MKLTEHVEKKGVRAELRARLTRPRVPREVICPGREGLEEPDEGGIRIEGVLRLFKAIDALHIMNILTS